MNEKKWLRQAHAFFAPCFALSQSRAHAAAGHRHRIVCFPRRRVLFLETVAGVPGMMAGMVRHLRSLRIMRRDHGWIHTLLEEAENERMHLSE